MKSLQIDGRTDILTQLLISSLIMSNSIGIFTHKKRCEFNTSVVSSFVKRSFYILGKEGVLKSCQIVITIAVVVSIKVFSQFSI